MSRRRRQISQNPSSMSSAATSSDASPRASWTVRRTWSVSHFPNPGSRSARQVSVKPIDTKPMARNVPRQVRCNGPANSATSSGDPTAPTNPAEVYSDNARTLVSGW
jgi:hypothetical protein